MKKNKTLINRNKVKIQINKEKNTFSIPLINFRDNYYKINTLYYTKNETTSKLEKNLFELLLQNEGDKSYEDKFNNPLTRLNFCALFYSNLISDYANLEIEYTMYSQIFPLFKPITKQGDLQNLFEYYFSLTKHTNLKYIRSSNYLYFNIIWGIDYHNIKTVLNQLEQQIIRSDSVCDHLFTFLIFELIRPYNFIHDELKLLILLNSLLNNSNIDVTMLTNLKLVFHENEAEYIKKWDNFYEDGDLSDLMTFLLSLLIQCFNKE